MLDDNFQSGANSETQQWDKGIPEPDAVHIIIACSPDQLSGSLVSPKKHLQNGWFYVLGGQYLLGGLSTGPPGIWSNVGANEPTGEPPKTEVVDSPALAALQSARDRWQIDFIRDAEVLQALAHAPSAWPGLPIELNRIEFFCNGLCALVGGIYFSD